MTGLQSRHVVVNGVCSPVLVGGCRHHPDLREAVVFVHGNPDAGGDWEPLMTRVAEFATVVAPCTLAGVRVRALPPDFTKVSAPEPLSTIWLLMVAVLLA